jgi:predicted Zn-dependent protease
LALRARASAPSSTCGIDKHAEAQTLYAAVVEARALPWAKLGIARTQLAAGQIVPARRTLDALIGEHADNTADSYDVLGRVLVEQGEMQAAYEIYQKAAELTPGSVTRSAARWHPRLLRRSEPGGDDRARPGLA